MKKLPSTEQEGKQCRYGVFLTSRNLFRSIWSYGVATLRLEVGDCEELGTEVPGPICLSGDSAGGLTSR